jgi:hypothetical protein
VEYHCALIKVDWLDACIAPKSGWRCIGRFPPAFAQYLHNTPANGKQGPIPEEMSQTN